MTNLFLGTSFNSAYPWGQPWRESLEKHCNIPFHIIDLDKVETDMPKKIIQHGEWLDYFPDGSDDDVILFVDADCILQRPFSEDELSWMKMLTFGEFGASINVPHVPSLLVESSSLCRMTKNFNPDDFSKTFPGHDRFLCYHGGFMCATRGTWKLMRLWFEKYWPVVDALWYHYAKMQWLISYVMQRYMIPELMPETMGMHGLCGMPVHASTQGDTICMRGKPVAIRHGMNLTPPKPVVSPEESRLSPVW